MKKLPIFNYKITNQNGERLDVFIDGTIVDAETQELYKEWFNDTTSVSFKSFRTEILDSGLKKVRITVNSFGGQIGDAMAMHDLIQQLENEGYEIETIGMGMVCSAATYIVSAAKNSKISPNSWYMIHNVSGFAWGDVNEIEKQARSLRSFNDNIRDFYVNLTGNSKEQVEEWMNAETWFTGPQAVENKFVNATTDQENLKPINKTDWTFKNQNPVNVYNSFVNKPAGNEDENLIQNLDMKNLATLIGTAVSNALTNFSVTPKPAEGAEGGAAAEPVTNEALTEVITNALAEVKFDEHITNAVTEMFKDGLPENMVAQITEAVKPGEPAPLNLAENEDYKGLIQRVEKVENKILNGVGAAQPPKNEGEKFEGVSFD